MMKRVSFIVAIVIAVVSFSGCSVISGTTPEPTPKIIKKMSLASNWQVYQIKVDIGAGMELPVVLKLTNGDKVDGYFYLEKGNRVDVSVAGISQLYHSEPPAAGKVNSDRFSFTSTQAQGATYTIALQNTNTEETISVYLELIYPATGSIFIPLESK